MIRIEMIRQDTRDPDKRKRHPSRVSCEVAGRRFEAEGPAPIYRLSTLLWIYGHGGADFEVYDDVSPCGKSGGLAMHGRVRNWARFSGKGPTFDRRAAREPGFTELETVAVADAAGKVTSPGQKAGGRGGEAHTARSRPKMAPPTARARVATETALNAAILRVYPLRYVTLLGYAAATTRCSPLRGLFAGAESGACSQLARKSLLVHSLSRWRSK